MHRLVFECSDPFSSINLDFVAYGFGIWVMYNVAATTFLHDSFTFSHLRHHMTLKGKIYELDKNLSPHTLKIVQSKGKNYNSK